MITSLDPKEAAALSVNLVTFNDMPISKRAEETNRWAVVSVIAVNVG